jgi:hypothetical protein
MVMDDRELRLLITAGRAGKVASSWEALVDTARDHFAHSSEPFVAEVAGWADRSVRVAFTDLAPPIQALETDSDAEFSERERQRDEAEFGPPPEDLFGALLLASRAAVDGLAEMDSAADTSEYGRLRYLTRLIEDRQAAPPYVEPPDCRAKTCTYYWHYLAQGPDELTHEGFHAAEKACAMWQQRQMEHTEQAHPIVDGVAQGRPVDRCEQCHSLDRICETWERRVRA